MDIRDPEKKFYFICIFFVMVLVLLPQIQRSEKSYAKRLEFEGVVIEKERKSRNHGLPKYVIELSQSKRRLTVSHSSVDLNYEEIEVGDFIEKKRGDIYCRINGKGTVFSKTGW